MAQVSLSDGNGSVSSRGPPIAQLTNGSGEIDISSAGVTGGLAGTVTITPPGATLIGTFQLLVNTTAQASSVTLSGQSTPLPAGPYFEFPRPARDDPGCDADDWLADADRRLHPAAVEHRRRHDDDRDRVDASLSIVSGTTTLLAVSAVRAR